MSQSARADAESVAASQELSDREGTPAWYAATRARVEARGTLEQAEELRRTLEVLGEGLGT